MTLPQFLKQVNGVLEKMPEEELRSFIIDVAQSLPEGRRDSFLRMMKNAKGLSHKTGENPGAKTVHDEVEKMIKEASEEYKKNVFFHIINFTDEKKEIQIDSKTEKFFKESFDI